MDLSVQCNGGKKRYFVRDDKPRPTIAGLIPPLMNSTAPLIQNMSVPTFHDYYIYLTDVVASIDSAQFLPVSVPIISSENMEKVEIRCLTMQAYTH